MSGHLPMPFSRKCDEMLQGSFKLFIPDLYNLQYTKCCTCTSNVFLSSPAWMGNKVCGERLGRTLMHCRSWNANSGDTGGLVDTTWINVSFPYSCFSGLGSNTYWIGLKPFVKCLPVGYGTCLSIHDELLPPSTQGDFSTLAFLAIKCKQVESHSHCKNPG
jgi:hypothetical protein